MKTYLLKILGILILLQFSSAAFGQAQMSISLVQSEICPDTPVKIRLNSYSGISWPVDNLQQREYINNAWGLWTNVPVSIGYDGVSYFWSVTADNKTQFRAKEAVSGGTLYSNTITLDIYSPRLLLYGQDQGLAINSFLANQEASIDFDINPDDATSFTVTWYKNGVSQNNNSYNGTACSSCSHTYEYSGSQNQTWKAYIHNNTLNCGSYTNSITISPAPFISITSVDRVNPNQSFDIKLVNYYHSNLSMPINYIQKREFSNGVWGAWQNLPISMQYNYMGQAYWPVTITKRSQFRVGEPVSGGTFYSNSTEVSLHNYVIENIPRIPIGIESSVSSSNVVANVNKTYHYADGLGRAMQSVIWQGSPSQKDIVQPNYYDGFGREYRQYLPVVVDATDGRYKEGIFDTQGNYIGAALNFYNTAGDNIPDDPKPYAETVLENSPFNRVIKQGAPGQAWYPDATQSYASTDHTIKYSYESNSANEVLKWEYTYPTSSLPFGIINATLSATPTIPNYYPANSLIRTRTKDENNNETIEYTNLLGQVVLKRVQIGTSTTINDTNYASTYYIYDDFGMLVCVVPPEATGRLSTEYYQSGATSSTKDAFMNTWAFRYVYDEKRRMIIKQVPGAEPIYMVYNDKDLLVMTQDGNQRPSKQWTYTKYDKFYRPVITGLYTHSTVIDQLAMSALISQTNFFEAYNGAASTHGYTNNVWPTTNITALSISYYDNYSFKSLKSGLNYVNTQLTGQPSSEFANVKGLVTGSKINELGTVNYYWEAQYYDSKYQTIQSIRYNQKGGKETVTNLYNFAGQVTQTKRTHTASGQPTITLLERFDYDHMGRVLKHYHKADSQTEIILAAYEYNEIGQLVEKNLHSENSGSSYLQSVDYRYNIRGWLSHINNATLSNETAINDDNNDLFGMELKYNTDIESTGNNTQVQYNGNISQILWKTSGQTNFNAYDFTYDAMNRLKTSRYEIYSIGWTSNTARYRFDEDVSSYDRNGNIKTLIRKGEISASPTFGTMDQLTYTYSGNRLSRVDDSANDNIGFSELVAQANEYTYDANGNMKTDLNKGISSITYNHLNLPQTVTKGSTTVQYTYDASGQKLKKTVGSNIAEYIAGIHYENNLLTFVQTAEGRVRKDGNSWVYEYNLTDHLGNVRVSFDKNPTTGVARLIQKDDYYPFGLTFNSYTSGLKNNYLYNEGSELQEELGVYQTDFRMLDPALGRWWQVDPKANEFESPYVSMANNPILYNDPLGDTINFSQLIVYDKANGTNHTQTIVNSLSKMTGLTLSVDSKTGYLNYAKDDKGNAIVASEFVEEICTCVQKGSSTARGDLVSAIDGDMTQVGFSPDRTATDGSKNQIWFSPSQVDGFMNNTPSELNNETLGYGMTFMHELRHTSHGGQAKDPANRADTQSTGPVVDRVNQYRRELGWSYGQRGHYNPKVSGSRQYVNFNYQIYKNGKVRNRTTSIKVN